MNKEFWRTGGLVVPAVLLAACGGQKGDAGKPLNIIHIMTDDHSWQTLSAYGHALGKVAPTPNLDRLAAEGMLFRQAFVENSLSTPSRACLMTGLYSHQSGQRQLGAGIDTTKVFFSELLQAHGYETAVVGKWHLLCEPKGFDYYQVLWDQGDYYNPDFKSKETEGKYVKRQGYATTLTTDYAIDFLEHRNPEKPFCLLVHHKAPHRNWMPEEKYLELIRRQIEKRTVKLDYLSGCLEKSYGGVDPVTLTGAARGDYLVLLSAVMRERTCMDWLRRSLEIVSAWADLKKDEKPD